MTLGFSLPNNNSAEAYLSAFIQTVIYKFPTLTINGITGDDHYNITQGIHNAKNGSVIIISDKNHYDIDWYPNAERAAINGVQVVYNIENDFGKIMSYLENYTNRNNTISRNIGNGYDGNFKHKGDSYFAGQLYVRKNDKLFTPDNNFPWLYTKYTKPEPKATRVRLCFHS